MQRLDPAGAAIQGSVNDSQAVLWRASQGLEELLWVGHCGSAADGAQLAAPPSLPPVVAAQPAQARQCLRHASAKHAPVGVRLVQDEQRQPPQEPAPPTGVCRAHVGIDDVNCAVKQVGLPAHALSHREGRVAIQHPGHHSRGQGRGVSQQAIQSQQLVIEQGLGGKDKQAAGPWLQQQRAQGREEVDQRLATASASAAQHILARGKSIQGQGLVAVQVRDAS